MDVLLRCDPVMDIGVQQSQPPVVDLARSLVERRNERAVGAAGRFDRYPVYAVAPFLAVALGMSGDPFHGPFIALVLGKRSYVGANRLGLKVEELGLRYSDLIVGAYETHD